VGVVKLVKGRAVVLPMSQARCSQGLPQLMQNCWVG